MQLIFITACNTSNPQDTIESSEAITQTQTDTSHQSSETSKFPTEVDMLLPTQYRKESTGYPKGVKEKEWYELYKDEKTNQWKVGKADLKITYDRDECVGEDIMIISSKRENAVLFFTPFIGLSESLTTALEDKVIFPERSTFFSLNNKSYKLVPTGSVFDYEQERLLTINEIKQKKEDDLEYTKISSYMLFFSNEEGLVLPIAHVDEIESTLPKLVWTGDLNGDGLPDLILDLSNFYESQHLLFYLSDINDKEKPLKLIAERKVINDC